MTRQTSITVYHRIKAAGLLSKTRWIIYDWLFHNGPATAREVFHGINRPPVQATRLTELRDMLAIEEFPVRKCRVSGETVLTWDVTGRMPIKLKKKKKKLSRSSLSVLRTAWKSASTTDRRAIERVVEIAR